MIPATVMPTVDEVARCAASAAFGRPLLTNVMRATVVEAIVAKALPDWTWCSADYAPYDFLREDSLPRRKLRLEVKQSAACQSWPTGKPSEIRWDIAERLHTLEGDALVKKVGRSADVYVLAAHLQQERALADHRDASQWRFYVVTAGCLPAHAKTIGKSVIEKIAASVGFEELSPAVEEACAQLGLRSAAGPSAGSSQANAPETALQIG